MFDRSKLKGTNLAALQKQKQELESKVPRTGGGRLDYHDVDNGKNFFRLYPGHYNEKTQEQDSFLFPKSGTFLPIWTDARDDKGKVKKDDSGKAIRELKQKFIFDARVHGNCEKDIIDQYRSFAFAMLGETQDQDEKDEILGKIKGNFKKKVNGIMQSTTWIGYADKFPVKSFIEGDYSIKSLKRVELKTSVKDAMDIIADVDDPDQPMGLTDPFSDPDEGCILQVKKDLSEEPSKMYKTNLLHKIVIPLTDEELEVWSKQEPLRTMYGSDVYRRKDFDFAVEGLMNFEEKSKLGIFQNPEFMDILEEIEKLIPADEEEDNESEVDEDAPTATAHKKVTSVPKDEVEDEVEDNDHDISQMNRTQLKAYIRENELPIVVKTSDTEASLRLKILNEIATPVAPPEDEVDDSAEQEAKKAMPWNDPKAEAKHKETVAAKKSTAKTTEKAEEKSSSVGSDRLAKFKERMKR